MTRARETSENTRLAKAWVNFNGTGTVAIRSAFNVSSITDNGVGNYTVNFATAMSDANYSLVGGHSSFANGGTQGFQATLATLSATILSRDGGVATDPTTVHIAIFR